MVDTSTAAALTASGEMPGQPYYEKTRKHLQDLLRRKALCSQSLQTLEDQIYKKETEYLEETLAGNIILGFENYTKGTGAILGAGRKRGNAVEGNRVFTRSSISFTAAAEESVQSQSSQSTPTAAMAPTPISTAFLKGEGGSSHGTPTSATSSARMGGGLKKKKKDGAEDSDTERETKKARTHFSATRKA